MKAEDVLLSTVAKKILVIGDGLVDVNIVGKFADCQDGCPKFVEESGVTCRGGANNAAHSLEFSGAAVISDTVITQTKTRFLVDGKIVWRHDDPLREFDFTNARRMAMNHVMGAGAVYLADYAKGFFDDGFMEAVIAACRERGIPVVCDPKRDPECGRGAVLKCNAAFLEEYGDDYCKKMGDDYGLVVTNGGKVPDVYLTGNTTRGFRSTTEASALGWQFQPAPPPVNHVGAGDCFGAWLTLGLAHGLELSETARLAHAAGRVYVQHLHNRPPRWHEIMKELDPVGGKLLRTEVMSQFRASLAGRVVFCPGVFRLPHAGHAWLLDWAKKQGGTLVVGVNDDVSAFRVKQGAYCLPLEQRLHMLASLQCVDWVVPFSDNTPVEVMQALGLLPSDLMVKGYDRTGEAIPGEDRVETVIAPPGPFPVHAGDIVKAIRG